MSQNSTFTRVEDSPTGKKLSGPVGWMDDRLGLAAAGKKNLRKVFPEHWSFMLGEIALWSFVVLLLTGYEADMDLLRSAGITLTGVCQTPTFHPATMQTDVPGLYVAGTAVGGTQDKYSVFIENCHVHVERIVRALTGRKAIVTRVDTQGREES